jgi:hypothetical protein
MKIAQNRYAHGNMTAIAQYKGEYHFESKEKFKITGHNIAILCGGNRLYGKKEGCIAAKILFGKRFWDRDRDQQCGL